MKIFLNKKARWLLYGLAILVGIFIVYALWEKNWHASDKRKTLAAYATAILDECKDKAYRPDCYDKAIPRLMDAISMEEAFEVTRLVQEKDDGYAYCHVLGHNLSAREAAKDLSLWKSVIARCPSGMCSNGCLHGAMQERFRGDSLTAEQLEEAIPDLQNVCEQKQNFNPTGLEQSSCYHAVGHLLMYMTKADIPLSLTLCDRVAVKSNGRTYVQVCNDGVFMQMFQPLEPEDFALVKGMAPTKEGLTSYCSTFKGIAHTSCWSEGWPLFWGEVNTPRGLVKFCSTLQETESRGRCFNAMFFLLTAQFHLEEGKITEFCNGLPTKALKGTCFANGAARMIETDAGLIHKSVALCATAEVAGVGERCYHELLVYSTFNFHAGGKSFTALCEALPGAWSRKCFNREVTN